jgi:hypothetical protein
MVRTLSKTKGVRKMFIPEISETIISLSVDLIEYCTIGLVVFFVAIVIGAISSSG